MAEYDNNKNGNDDGQNGYEDVCIICHRPESKAGRMFKLPHNICVCSDCMHKTMDSMSQFNFQGMTPPFYDFGAMTGSTGSAGTPVQEKKPEDAEIVKKEEEKATTQEGEKKTTKRKTTTRTRATKTKKEEN